MNKLAVKSAVVILFVVALLPRPAAADQFVWVDVREAASAQRLLAGADEIRHLCPGCGDTTATPQRVEHVEIGLAAYDKRRPWARDSRYWQVYVNGWDIDLAYVYVHVDGEWRNLALLVGLPASGVSPRLVGVALAADASPPFAAGEHAFTLRFVADPARPGVPLRVRVDGEHVQVILDADAEGFARGVIGEGNLFLHPSGQWVVAAGEAQRNADVAPNCPYGPNVIDLVKREYWTC